MTSAARTLTDADVEAIADALARRLRPRAAPAEEPRALTAEDRARVARKTARDLVYSTPLRFVDARRSPAPSVCYILVRDGVPVYVGKTRRGMDGRYPFFRTAPDFEGAVLVECATNDTAHALEGALVDLLPRLGFGLDNVAHVACNYDLRAAWLDHPDLVVLAQALHFLRLVLA